MHCSHYLYRLRRSGGRDVPHNGHLTVVTHRCCTGAFMGFGAICPCPAPSLPPCGFVEMNDE